MKSIYALVLIIALNACHSSKKIVYQNAATINPIEKLGEKIDFIARGNNPSSWQLEMSINQYVRFKTLDGNNIIASFTPLKPEADNETLRMDCSTSQGAMQVRIFKVDCKNELSNESYNRKVEVMLANKTYNGCGQFLLHPQLQGSWQLVQFKQEKLTAKQFAKGLPVLRFDFDKGIISGHDGCNSLKATVESFGNMIKPGNYASTKMACPNHKNLHWETIFNNQWLSYQIQNDQLILSLPDDGIALFNKKD